MQQIYSRTPMPKCDFNISAKQLYWNHTSEWECFTRTHLESCFCLRQGSVCIMQKSVLISNGNKSTASYMMKILNFIKKVLEVSKKDVTHWENPCLKSNTLSKYSLIGWKNYLHLRKVKGLKRHPGMQLVEKNNFGCLFTYFRTVYLFYPHHLVFWGFQGA